jgi:peptidoglycan/xylan/chitin deacetylase (PgdA/CDA1 family)
VWRPRRGQRKRTRLAAAGFAVLVAAGVTTVAVPAAVSAATPTMVSLTFDNNTISSYTLGYQQALQPGGVNATFYVNSGTVGTSAAKYMTWSQLGTLASAGNEIGGKTVDGINLTTLTTSQQIAEICNDRQNIISHGITPFTFAYPGGANNSTIQTEVQNCGYGNARTAGSLSPTGATYAETLPPRNWLALRAWAPAGQITLANLESIVSGAASHGGGWIPIVIQKVCSQTLDPSNYSTCTSSAGWVDLGDLQTFLSWVKNAGQPGGGPAGAAFKTMSAAAASADTVAPTTSITCNGAACTSSTYSGTVNVALSAVDLGSGLASAHYTTDGTTPTQSSPTYTGPFNLTSSATVQYRSWDNAGNAETTHSQAVQIQQSGDTTPPTTTISCNGAACASTPYTGQVAVTLSATDNPGGWGVDKTYYTTDGSTPTTSSTVYTGPVTLTQTSTVKFFSTDLAGNAESVNSQPIQVQPYKTVVSLTFDDAYQNQWLYLRPLLQSHNMNATIYVITSDSDGPFQCCMGFAQLRTLQREGNDIGGHGVQHLNLTDPGTTYDQKVADVCGSRTDLINNGINDPASYAYPFGAFNSTAESIVQSCGYQESRSGGGLTSSTTTPSSPWAETLPPKDPYALRTVDVDAPNAKTLSDLKSFVTAAASHGGGWLPLTFHQICDQGASDYSSCMSTWSAVDDKIMGQFMDWLQNAGQAGGAPAGVSVQTARSAMNTPDTTPPTTSALCAGSPCTTSTYGGSVSISLTATDSGGTGVAKTYYTTDGSTPTTSSPVYDTPLLLLKTTTVKFFSVDNAGNAEAARTATIQVGSNADPVIAAAGDIACDPTQTAFHGGTGTNTDCRELGTSNLLTGADAVLPMGDNQYGCGGYNAFLQSYDPTWGRFKSISYPVPGDHDLDTTGGTDCPTTPGAGYQQYFSTTAGVSGSAVPSVVNTDPSTGYYSYNLGSWHVIALNSGACEASPSFCAAGSAQDQWLQNDLAHDTAACTLAYMQQPRWASNGRGGYPYVQPLWQDLYNGGVDVVLGGHTHWYERYQPLDANGNPNSALGVTEFIVGTGGQGLDTPSTQDPNSVVLSNAGHGVLQMTLHGGNFDWKFLSDTDGTTNDSGSAPCHGAPETTAPTTTMSINGGTSSGWFNAPVSVSLSATDNTGGSGVSATYYTTDGSTPTTSSTKYTGPFTVSSTSTVKFFSVDNAGNTESVKSQLIQIDTVAPTTTISCNSATCSAGWNKATPVTITLSGNDNTGGSGVSVTMYTTDGTNPQTSSTAILYTGPFTMSQTTTVKYYSIDNVGNSESVKSQLIQIDAAAPTVSITSPANASSFTQRTKVTVTASATDLGTGSGTPSGIGSVTFYLDGTTKLATVTKSPYSFTWNTSGVAKATHKLTAVATDVAGNSTTSAAISVSIK